MWRPFGNLAAASLAVLTFSCWTAPDLAIFENTARIVFGQVPVGQSIVPSAGGQAAVDWGPSMVCWWDCEESTGSTRECVAGSCATGTDCDLTESAGDDIALNTTEYREGSGSCDFGYGDAERLLCAAATCDELAFDTEEEVTAGAWSRPTQNGAEMYVLEKESWVLAWDDNFSTDNAYSFGSNGGVWYSDDTSNDQALNTWAHVALVYETAGTNSIQTFVNGVASDSAATGTTGNNDSNDFNLSDDNTVWGGQIDEAFVDNVAWTASELCRVKRCQINGILCMCDASTPANYLTCSDNDDCRVSGNTTAICDTETSTCQGRDLDDNDCSPVACNASAPS